MPSKKKSAVSLLSLAAPAVLLAAIGGVLSAKVGLFDDLKDGVDLSVKAPVTVTIAPREMSYRAEGHFLKNGFAVDAPIVVAAPPVLGAAPPVAVAAPPVLGAAPPEVDPG